MWTQFFKDKSDFQLKLCTLLLCCFVLTVHNVRALEESQNETTWTQDFSAGLYESVKESQPQNFVLSPFSLRNVLAMLSLGARGETAEEIQKVLQLPVNASELINKQSEITLSLKEISSGYSNVKFVTVDKVYANSGWTLKTEYKNNVTGLGGEIETVDFGNSRSAARKINSWVQRKTKGKISKIVESSALNSQTSLVVVNAIYFKGFWKSPFDNSSTKRRPFFLNATSSVNVDMMSQENEFPFDDLEEAKSQVLILPYQKQGKRLSMMIYLPNRKEEEALDHLENWLKNQSLVEIGNFKIGVVSVSLPKFKIRSSLDLNEPLKNLGLGKMFDQVTADFSGIFEGSGNFFVSKVSQETFIEVNEGEEATGATDYSAENTCTSPQSLGDCTNYSERFYFDDYESRCKAFVYSGCGGNSNNYLTVDSCRNKCEPVYVPETTDASVVEPPTPEFTVDRPFLFQIVDIETKTVLLTGRVKNPLDSGSGSGESTASAGETEEQSCLKEPAETTTTSPITITSTSTIANTSAPLETNSSCEGSQKWDLEELFLDFANLLAPNETESPLSNLSSPVFRLQVLVEKYGNKTEGAMEFIQRMNSTLTRLEKTEGELKNKTQEISELKEEKEGLKRSINELEEQVGNLSLLQKSVCPREVTGTRTTTEKPCDETNQENLPAAASGYFSGTRSPWNWNYNATLDGSCFSFDRSIFSVYIKGSSCVALYQAGNCTQEKFQMDTTNLTSFQDVEIPFKISKTAKSIGVCSSF